VSSAKRGILFVLPESRGLGPYFRQSHQVFAGTTSSELGVPTYSGKIIPRVLAYTLLTRDLKLFARILS
jgi:hypothetical protein